MRKAYLGQNFLTDKIWQEKIIDLFKPESSFGEIGPGHGELTQHLKKKFKSFVVFEMDPELVDLHRRRSEYNVIEGDFCDWDFHLNGELVQNFSFIGNLPYESGTRILKHIVQHSSQVSGFLFLLQKEVTERITAKPHGRDFGSLSVLIQGQFDVRALDIIEPEFFSPPPKVRSQLIQGRIRKSGRHPLEPGFQKFLKFAFLQKRKTLRNALKAQFSAERIDRLLNRYGWNALKRAEEIDVDLWPKIYEDLRNG